MTFSEYLEVVEGISWEYYDNNYAGVQADEVWERYVEFIEKIPVGVTIHEQNRSN